MADRGSGGNFIKAGLRAALAGGLAVILLSSPAVAQNPPPAAPPAEPAAAPLTLAQLDRLTAPIALYPDPLVAQILVAATYPLEIVEADRWLQQPEHAALKGDALAAALVPLPWDESVKSLAAFPQILAMMDKYLSWTEDLGDAFLAEQGAIMDSVQRLRRRAEAAGGLASTPEEVVSDEGGPIVIEPANPEIVYVPVYDPNLAYGEWPYPDNPPYYFPDVFPAEATGGIAFVEVIVVERLRPRRRCDWRRHRIDIDTSRFGALDVHHPALAAGVWQHDPAHRRGVPYTNPAVRARFQAAATADRVHALRGLPAAARAPLVRPAIGAGHPPSVVASRPRAPQIVRPPGVTVARPPVVLRGATPAVSSFRRAPEMPAAARLEPAGRVSMPAPVVAMPAPATAVAPWVAPTPRIAPAPRAAPAPDWMTDHR